MIMTKWPNRWLIKRAGLAEAITFVVSAIIQTPIMPPALASCPLDIMTGNTTISAQQLIIGYHNEVQQPVTI